MHSPPLPLSPSQVWFALTAVGCGAIASSAIVSDGNQDGNQLLPLAMAALLALAWITLWVVIAGVNWSEPLASWRLWTVGEPFRTLPYTQPGSDAARVATHLGQFRHWLNVRFIPQHGATVLIGASAIIVAVVLAAALGAQAILLTMLAVCAPQIAVLACRGNGRPSALLQSLVAATLPLMLGYAVFLPLSPPVAVVAVGFGFIAAGVLSASPALRNIGYALVLMMLIAVRQPVAAFVVAALWLPQWLMSVTRGSRAWLAASMLAWAIALAW